MSRPAPPGRPLALLDVLCCGLGAAVLLLMVIRQAPPADAETLAAQVAEAQAALLRAETETEDLRRLIQDAQEEAEAESRSLQTAQTRRDNAAELLRKSAKEAVLAERGAESERTQLRDEIAGREEQTPVREPPQPKQLTGLRMAADRSLILLDRSASMLSRRIVDIVQLRASSAEAQASAHKWRTAKDAARWAMARIPKGGRRRLLAFSSAVTGLDGDLPHAGAVRWSIQGDPQEDSEAMRKGLEALLPNGPTDLKTALQAASRLVPLPRQILIITDGLPTLAGGTPLRSLKHCPRTDGPRAPIISSDCRVSVFIDATKVAEKRLSGVRFDIILLPMEGDPNAAHGYWLMTGMSGGRLLTPAYGWPTS